MQVIDERLDEATGADPEPEVAPAPARSKRRVRRFFMRPRRVLVKLHRWLGIGLFVWLCIIGLTGSWLAESARIEGWLHPERYRQTEGDVGASAVVDAAADALPEGATVYGLTTPSNGGGVYLVYGEGEHDEEDPTAPEPDYYQVHVDPGTGEVNAVTVDGEGLTNWLFRGHEYLWQDFGVAGVFDPESGWCRADAEGNEPGGARGVACDVIPDGMDLIAWFALAFIVLLVSGFYLWYWPGVKRWATALVVKRSRGRFAFHLSLHRVIGLVVWVPLLVVAFTGAAFAFPNMAAWFDNATPAQRDFFLWEPAEETLSGEADGREMLAVDEVVAIVDEAYPDRAIRYIGIPHEGEGSTETFQLWTSRGYDPWTRQGGAGNAYVWVDQYSGEIVYDGTPEDGNVFDQAWDDWSYPLHTGDFAGSITRFLWFLLGITPVVLGVTGIVMNLVRRTKRAKRRPTAEPQPAAASA